MRCHNNALNWHHRVISDQKLIEISLMQVRKLKVIGNRGRTIVSKANPFMVDMSTEGAGTSLIWHGQDTKNVVCFYLRYAQHMMIRHRIYF